MNPRLAGDEAAVGEEVGAGAEAGGVGGQEIDKFGDLGGFPDAAAGIEGVLLGPQALGADMLGVGCLEAVEQVVDQGGADGSGANGVDPYAVFSKVD